MTRRFSQIFVVFLENLNCTSNSLIQSPELQRHSVWFLAESSSQEWQSVSWNFGKVQTFVSLWHLTYSCPNQDLHPVSEIKQINFFIIEVHNLTFRLQTSHSYFIYRTRAIITRGLYNFYPFFILKCCLYYRHLMD